MTETPETDATSALIDALAGGGELVDEGRFRLDLERAREKLRAYSLSVPALYTCLLVEVAVLAGAERIDFELVPDGLTARFGGAGFDASELEWLSEAPFVDIPAELDETERRRRRALQILSLATQAALGLGARTIELRSPPSERALKIDAGEDEGEERWSIDAKARTTDVNTISVRFPPRLRSSDPPGVEQLRQRCEWSNFPIYIGSERISRGPAAAFLDVDGESLALVEPAPIHGEDGQTIGVGTILKLTAYKTPVLHVLCNGWHVEQLSVPTSLVGFEAVVEIDLRRDLSQAKFLRNERFDAMCAAVSRCAAQLEGSGHVAKRYDPEVYQKSRPTPVGVVVTWTIFVSLFAACAMHESLFLGVFGLCFMAVGVFAIYSTVKAQRAWRHNGRGLTRYQTDKLLGRR
ncbi:hypothetical protein G6O69_29315 [Pseudenhygromyxa sp. WMMC2535]|uniref:hypothetical protein n=1 Tax=Pseudenhygromyxa sp. WMMC2535 TaxID=2712867 RepID=UPI00155748B2|nr:hypothetical protein [Pseudenhygromyxa sp. WMMC2535]NVB41963.1 hypothetical protein [Pseudenhygromyxa sp. WMMC2535]